MPKGVALVKDIRNLIYFWLTSEVGLGSTEIYIGIYVRTIKLHNHNYQLS